MPDLSSKSFAAEGASLPYRQRVDGCLEGAIGAHGLTSAQIERWLDKVAPALAALREDYRTGRVPLLKVPEETADIEAAAGALGRLSTGAETIVFFGTGGSSLGGQTLAQVAGWNISGGGSVYDRSRPRTRFFDNLDPLTLEGTLGGLDLERTRFVVTSKSGATAETLAQAATTLAAVRSAGLQTRIPELFLGVTEPESPGRSNGLRSLFASLEIPMLEHPAGVGGRFSCLTIAGLLAAMARGLDALEIRAGAREVTQSLLSSTRPGDFAPALGAAAAVALAKEKGIRTLVMMPYADRLGRFAHWWVQLWAESLGKGGEGTVPVAALGPLDQHSQLQLFMDGPREISLTLVRVATQGLGPRIDPALARLAGVPVMGDKTVGDIVAAQAHAVAEALAKAGRPVRTVDLDRLDERSVGALLMHFMIETILAGRLIGVDPFDQPAVELAKALTKERLSR
ncbi:MAG TPA: glucose-6-phosphate isomerase [Hyphomicrobiaceae bacterium]|nr:glucose-6-phosphate isomerase [Hyphomicrobiaceae bacterium]